MRTDTPLLTNRAETGAPHCALCQAVIATPHFTKARTAWWKCPECGLLFVHPQPDPKTLAALYEATYYAQPTDRTTRNLQRWRNRVATIGAECPPGKVLDVGCGRGEFLVSALERGWDAWGLEVSASAVSQLPEQLRFRAVVGSLPNAPFPDGSFDALTFFDVLEHVRQPISFLASGRRLLKSGGCLIITTPDAGSFKARVRGRFWKYFTFERYLHLYHFSANTLELSLIAAGFEVARWFKREGTPLFMVARKP